MSAKLSILRKIFIKSGFELLKSGEYFGSKRSNQFEKMILSFPKEKPAFRVP